jgi:aldehyde dehydrogenase (NAD+)
MPAKTYLNYVNGEWIPSHTGEVFENRNPANTDELIGNFQKSNDKDVNDAVAAAKEAFRKWSLLPAPRRAEILYNLGQRLIEKKEAYAQEMTREMGKIIKETRGDVQEAIDTSFLLAGEGRRLFGQTVPSEIPNKFAMSVRMPLGICALITPWNFPMAILSWKLLPALVCGNTVVIKPATDTPLSAYNLVQTCEEVGIPKGVVNLVTGSGSKVGVPMTQHKDIKLVSFTGSTEIGREVSKACAEDFRHCSLEMGGKNPIIIMDDANLENAVEGCLWGAFGTTGQRCTASSRLIVHEKIYKTFSEKLAARAKALKVGNGLDESTEMGPCINQDQLEKVEMYVEIGKKENARLICGGERLTGNGYSKGFFFQPTIFTDVDRKMRIAQEEIFGPVLSILPTKGLEEAIEIANDTIYGLSSAIYTQDIGNAFTAMRDLYTGIFYVNAPTIGAEVQLPFGGTNQTGNGHREAGSTVLDIFSEWKSIYVDFSGSLQKAQIDDFPLED